MITGSDTLPVWKKIYQVISCYNENVSVDVVEEVLKICKPKFTYCLADFKSYTKQGYLDWMKNLKLQDGEMNKFLHTLSLQLDLEVDLTWELICNYLMFEYYGKVSELKSIIRYERDSRYLIENIWHFYTSERMFKIKTLMLIFEGSVNKDAKFHAQFKEFTKTFDFKALWKNLIVVFKHLISEIDSEKANRSQCLEKWVKRNNQEQTEIILLMITTMRYLEMNGTEFPELLKVFLSHSFARHPLCAETTKYSVAEDFLKVKYAEIGCLLILAHRYWENPSIFQLLPPEIEKDLEILDTQEENAVVLLLWSVMKVSMTQTEEALDYCNNIIQKLESRDPFHLLYLLLQHPVFKTSKSGDTVKAAINKLLVEFLKMIENYNYIFEQKGVIQIVATLLEYEELDARTNFAPLIKCALEVFPLDFFSLTACCKSLVRHHSPEVFKLLTNLQSYLSLMQWYSINRGSEKILQNNEPLFDNSTQFIIPQGARAEKYSFYNQDLTKFNYNYSYFTLLEQYIHEVVSAKNYFYSPHLTHGFEVVMEMAKHNKDFNINEPHIKSCLKALNSLIIHDYYGTSEQFILIKLYFKVNFTLIIHNKATISDVFNRTIRSTVLQSINVDKLSVPEVFKIKFNATTPLYLCLQYEAETGDHSLLLMYIEFVKKMMEAKEYTGVSSGIWYLLLNVFPNFKNWIFDDLIEKLTIEKNCLAIFIKILEKYPSRVESEQKMFELIVHGFLTQERLLKIFLATLMRSKYYLQQMMEQDTDWIQGVCLIELDILRSQLTFVLLLLRHRKPYASQKIAINDFMELLCRSVSCYLVNPYNVNLTRLSCKFLGIVAQDPQFPLLALLGLDHEQIQRLFLDKLRDPLEDEDVKHAIIDLIRVCVSTQNGMTAAFFNVPCSKKWYSSDIREKIETASLGEDTVIDFMIDYLNNIKKTADYLKNPLQLGILQVMCSLWEERKQHLIQDIINLSQFWYLLADPFWKKFDNKQTVYKCIINIFNMELYYHHEYVNNELSCLHKGTTCNLGAVLEKFLTTTDSFQAWLDYLVSISKKLPSTSEEIDELVGLVRSWTAFLVLIEDRGQKFFYKYEFRIMNITTCLDVLSLNFSNTPIIQCWLDLCCFFLSRWSSTIKPVDQPKIISKFIQACQPMRLNYNNLPKRCRETFLCSFNSLISALNEYFEEHPDKLIELLNSVDYIIDIEYYILYDSVIEKLKRKEIIKPDALHTWGLLISLVNSIISLNCYPESAVWLYFKEYFHKLTVAIPDLMKYRESLSLAKLSLHSLLLFMRSRHGSEVYMKSLIKFFDDVEGPIKLLILGEPNKINFPQLQDGWLLCTLLMQFNHVLINKYQYAAAHNCITFFSLNDAIMQQIFSLIEATVDLHALDLVNETLLCIHAILCNWRHTWYCKANGTYHKIIIGVKKIINCCISVILRPKNISFHPLDEIELAGKAPDSIAADLMMLIMNKLIEIISNAFLCLYKFNPPLIKLLDSIHEEEINFDLLINDFSVPNLDAGVDENLTYGKLLCIAHFLCKALNVVESKPAHKSKCETLTMAGRKMFCKYIGLIDFCSKMDNMHSTHLSTFLRFAVYEYSGMSDPWIQELETHHVKTAFEILMTFLGSQAYLALNTMEPQEWAYYQRNICSELQFFNDYLKRRTGELLKTKVTTPVRMSDPFTKNDKELYKRYLTHYWNNKEYDTVVDEHFLVVLSAWFTEVCQLK